eukprot:453364-Pleurochrysis_carterae.AAC.1
MENACCTRSPGQPRGICPGSVPNGTCFERMLRLADKLVFCPRCRVRRWRRARLCLIFMGFGMEEVRGDDACSFSVVLRGEEPCTLLGFVRSS